MATANEVLKNALERELESAEGKLYQALKQASKPYDDFKEALPPSMKDRKDRQRPVRDFVKEAQDRITDATTYYDAVKQQLDDVKSALRQAGEFVA